MRLEAAIVSSLVLAAALSGQAPPTYYSTVNATSAAQLRATLHAVIDDHTRFPYTASTTDTWNILESGQQDPANANSIVDLYKNASFAKIGGGVGPYNREHRWPKSYGFPVDGTTNYPYTDCFHLKLCDSAYNTVRSNRPYAPTTAAGSEYPTDLTNGSGGGSGTYPGNSNWIDSVTTNGRWQVWGDRRGDCARAIFYMDVRYEGGTHGVTNAAEPQLSLTDTLALITASNTGSNASSAYMGMLATLLAWHAADPVDARERAFNDLVYSHQGNRNPFIDHPEWAACLYSNSCGSTQAPAAPVSLVATTGKRKVNLDWADNAEPDLASYRVLRGSARSGPFTQINAAPVTASAYVDNGVLEGTTWWYVVRAVNSSGLVSANSAPDVTRWPLAVPPGADALVPPTQATAMWINEIHYDNNGTDTNEFVEVAGPAGATLNGWQLVGYNGNGGVVYLTVPMSGTIPNLQNGMGTRSFAMVGLQNGAPDGIALVNASGAVVEFLSYEGPLTATSGPASGMTATQIPTGQDDTTPIGQSLQRQGTGRTAAAFTWSSPQAMTQGAVNTGQTLQ